MYKIKPRQRKIAKQLEVIIKPSTNRNKKIDVFSKSMKKLASIGGRRENGTFYNDYSTYLKIKPQKEADALRDAYLKRHSKEPKIKNGNFTASYYADKILWS